jgi:site-specific recombinase XerD
MGSLRRKTSTRQLPPDAELIQRRGKQFARWLDRHGKNHTAATTTGKDGSKRIVIVSGKWLGKYRNAAGALVEASTGCTDKGAASAILSQWEREAEREISGIVSSKEHSALGHAEKRLEEHLDSFDAARRAEGLSARQVRDTRDLIEKMFRECGFKTLASVQRHKVEEWLAAKAEAGTGARRRNIYVEAARAFLRWAVSCNRMLHNPLEGIARADQNADVRRERRALSEDELLQLLTATTLRPLAELGRETVMLAPEDGKRSCWTYAPLTLANLDAAVERALKKLADKPELIEAKMTLGRERGLIVKTLAMTGLRRGELAALWIRNLYLDELQPYIKLDRKSEKNRQGNSIPLRADLADDLRQWISDRAAKAQEAAQNVPTLSFESEAARMRRGEQQGSHAGTLSGDELLFNVPNRHALVKILDKDYAVAGIPKIDDRGRTVDVHCLRHSFATWIGESGVSPKAAQRLMRHSDVNLTMRYTHGTLEAELKALESLPTARLNPEPPVTGVATGTEECPPLFPPPTDYRGRGMSFAVKMSDLRRSPDETVGAQKRPENPVKQGISGHSSKYTREDSNLQPPVPKTGGVNSETVLEQQVATTKECVSASVSRKSQTIDTESKPEPSVTSTVRQKAVSLGASADVALPTDFAAALTMIATLPLSDEQKAEAVQRLLAQRPS